MEDLTTFKGDEIMSKRLDINKLHQEKEFKTISMKEVLKDVEPWIDFENEDNLKILQEKLHNNMDKAVELANKDIVRNEKGHVIISKDDEWRDEE
jgi:hypothetical protein